MGSKRRGVGRERAGDGPDPPVLLVLRALGLGDLLTSVPALRALRRAHPDHQLVLAAAGWLFPLVELIGAVDELLPAGHLTSLSGRVGAVDVAVNLHGRGPQSHQVLLELHPRRLVAFTHPDVPESAGMPEWRGDEHEVGRWCRLLEAAGVPADPADLQIAAPPPPAPELAAAAVVHPGAKDGARRWPAHRWADLARRLAEAGERVVITGSAHEVDLARTVARGAGLSAAAVLAGHLQLDELAGVVAHARSVCCGDTGVAHLATAAGTPSVVLFGPTPPAWWGPPPDRVQHRALWKGRRGDPHATEPDAGLLAITVDEVHQAWRSLPIRTEVPA